MEIFNGKRFIMLMVLILFFAGLTGCVKKAVYKTNPKLPDTVEDQKDKPATLTDSVGKMQGIADALGCMFAPETCNKNK